MTDAKIMASSVVCRECGGVFMYAFEEGARTCLCRFCGKETPITDPHGFPSNLCQRCGKPIENHINGCPK